VFNVTLLLKLLIVIVHLVGSCFYIHEMHGENNIKTLYYPLLHKICSSKASLNKSRFDKTCFTDELSRHFCYRSNNNNNNIIIIIIIRIKVHRTSILPVVLFGCGTLSLTFREKHSSLRRRLRC
jgi:hypothetical protein